MGYIAAIILIGIIAFAVYKFLNNNHVDLHEERAELQANLENTLDELNELEKLVSSEDLDEKENTRSLRLLKKRIASKKVAVKNTIGKVDLEGEQSWEYRKLQANRTMQDAKELTDTDLDKVIVST